MSRVAKGTQVPVADHSPHAMTASPLQRLRLRDALRVVAYGLRRDPVATLRGLYWRARGMRVRGCNLVLTAASKDPEYYRLWIRTREPSLLVSEPASSSSSAGMPTFVVALAGSAPDTPGELERTVRSVKAALGEATQIVHLSDRDCVAGLQKVAAALRAAAQDRHQVWLIPFAIGDRLSPATGTHAISAMRVNDAAVIYWDEDRLDSGCRAVPWLKPDWDELLLVGVDYLSGACTIRGDAALSALQAVADAGSALGALGELALNVALCQTSVAPLHLPRILTHRQAKAFFPTVEHRREAVLRHWSAPLELSRHARVPNALRIDRVSVATAPTVSIIVPTRDRVELLRTCLSGVEATAYPRGALEIIVVDNDSSDRAAIDYLASLPERGIRVLRHPGPFNFSAMNNHAAEQATGTFLCLLNNDIEVVDADWLTRMMTHASQPGVGAVGPLLLYPDGSVQHAGLAVGIGGAAGHAHRNGKVGLDLMYSITRRVTAVTGACLVVRREDYFGVGGLDAEAFPVAFNDVDFCLKLARAGLRNLFVAESCLIHHESKSRGRDTAPANRARFDRELATLRQRWDTERLVDPYHHPLLRRECETMILAL